MRRRHARFVLTEGWRGELRTFQDVVVQQAEDGEVWVTSTEPIRPGESVVLAFEFETEEVLEAHVATTMPMVQNGAVCHRARLEPAGGELRRVGAEESRWAALWRSTPATVVEVSRRGARVETHATLTAARVGRLSVEGPDGGRFEGGVRIAWSAQHEGGAILCRAGVELLPAAHTKSRATHGSLRDLLTVMEVNRQGAGTLGALRTSGSVTPPGGGDSRQRTNIRRWRIR